MTIVKIENFGIELPIIQIKILPGKEFPQTLKWNVKNTVKIRNIRKKQLNYKSWLR